jgi:tetratricopeptide (TPR) repeat protein
MTPFNPAAPPKKGLSANSEADLFANSSFLIVDDFDGMRSILHGLVRTCGGNSKLIDEASSGAEAVRMIEVKRYDTVLCDLNLGGGKNGQQVLEEARVRSLIGPACCWLMVTAEKGSESVIGTAEIQPDAYLIKPITEAVLVGRMQKIKAKKNAFIEIDAAMAAKNFLKAIQLCDERAQTDRANAVELLRLKCQLLAMAGQIDQAKEAYEAILATRDVPWAQLGLAQVYHQAGDMERARYILEQLVGRNRSYLEAYDWLSKTHVALDDKEKAEAVLDRALKLSPNSHKRQRSLGEVALQLGKLDNAEKAFRKSVSLAEHSVLKTPDAHLGLAKTLSAKGESGEALKVLDQMTQHFDSEEARVRGKAVAGMVHHENDDPEQALLAAQELGDMLDQTAVHLDAASAQEMASLMFATGEQDRAIALLETEVRNNPEDQALHESIRKIFHKAGLGDQGAEIVEKSRSEAVALMDRAVLLVKEKKYDEAIVSLRLSREQMPKNVRVLLNSAHVMITHMEEIGFDPVLATEARKCLMDAHQLAPGEQRFARMMTALDALSKEHSH